MLLNEDLSQEYNIERVGMQVTRLETRINNSRNAIMDELSKDTLLNKTESKVLKNNSQS